MSNEQTAGGDFPAGDYHLCAPRLGSFQYSVVGLTASLMAVCHAFSPPALPSDNAGHEPFHGSVVKALARKRFQILYDALLLYLINLHLFLSS